jgi:hypothetical protein
MYHVDQIDQLLVIVIDGLDPDLELVLPIDGSSAVTRMV